jgi:Zn-dependent M28 family amino/carboxypeptidase
MLQLRQEGYSLTGAPDVVERVWKTAERLGYQTTFLNEPMTGMTDDHIPLQGIGIPAIDLIDFEYGPNNAYHHTTEDTFDKVSARSLKVVGDVVMALIREHK